MIGVGIIGCGLIGEKRANALGAKAKLVACADLQIERAEKLSNGQARAFQNWRDLIALHEVDMVIVATLHDSLAEIVSESVKFGKHVLVEKPAARTVRELQELISEVQYQYVKIRVGFNHRYHRAMQKAKELVVDGKIGELMYIRGRYGHGGRTGYDQEWRANPKLSGGGELKDQGPHLIDLARWYLNQEFTDIKGSVHTYFWDMPVDDNGFMLLQTEANKIAFLHASCTEWKNLFSFEIFGRDGKLEINGLGGSYGVERLTWYKMLPQMGPPETISWEYPMVDNSWTSEISEFCDDIILDRQPSANLQDALASLKIIEKLYKDSGFDHCT